MNAQERMELRQIIGMVAEFEGVPFAEVAARDWDVFQASVDACRDHELALARAHMREVVSGKRMLALFEASGMPRSMNTLDAIQAGYLSIADIEAAHDVTEADIDAEIALGPDLEWFQAMG